MTLDTTVYRRLHRVCLYVLHPIIRNPHTENKNRSKKTLLFYLLWSNVRWACQETHRFVSSPGRYFYPRNKSTASVLTMLTPHLWYKHVYIYPHMLHVISPVCHVHQYDSVTWYICHVDIDETVTGRRDWPQPGSRGNDQLTSTQNATSTHVLVNIYRTQWIQRTDYF